MKAALAKLAALLLNKKTGKKVAIAIVSVVLAIILLLMSPLLILLSLADDLGYSWKQLCEVVVYCMTDGQLQVLEQLINTMAKVHDTMLMAGCTQLQVQWGVSLCMVEELLPYVTQDNFAARLTSCFTSPDMTPEDLKAALYNEFGVAVDLSQIMELRGHFFDADLPVRVLGTPDKKTNLDLVAWVTAAEQNGWGYIYGTFGQVLDETLYNTKASQYPDEVKLYEDFILEDTLGRRVADCIGLVKSYVWLDPEAKAIGYQTNGMPDVGADTAYRYATEKGTIDTLPEIPGLLLWMEGHVGVYIGGGEVIHSAGTTYGVIREEVGRRGWTHWAKIPYIEYVEETPEPTDPSVPTVPSEPTVPTEPTEPIEPDPTEPPAPPRPPLPPRPGDDTPIPLD